MYQSPAISWVLGRRVAVLGMLHSSMSAGLSPLMHGLSATLQLRPGASPLVDEPHIDLFQCAPLQKALRKDEM